MCHPRSGARFRRSCRGSSCAGGAGCAGSAGFSDACPQSGLGAGRPLHFLLLRMIIATARATHSLMTQLSVGFRTVLLSLGLLSGLGTALSCSSKEDDDGEEGCDPAAANACEEGLSCAETTAGDFSCFEAFILRGMVSSTADGSAIEGARLLALNDLGFAVGTVAESGSTGEFELEVPVLREEDGSPVARELTLQASASGYQAFPSGARVALPLSAEDAVLVDGRYVLDNAVTDIGLIPVEGTTGATASGRIVGLADGGSVAGVLVVATSESGSVTATTGPDGSFTLFNLAEGQYTVRAYGDGIQIGEESLNVTESEVEELLLQEIDEATTTVSGTIQIVNPGAGEDTSVILAVADTFNEGAARGEVPRGLRAPKSGPVSINGAFSIEGVPAGRYVVLAAYENDRLVRDPDTSIAGTDFVTVEVAAGQSALSIEESFKVTGALDVVFPGAEGPEAVSEAPVLEWVDDSSEEWYDVVVYDAFGETVWTAEQVPGVSGSETVTLAYEGPLDPGMFYQFRVTSWAQSGNQDPAPKSASEDLLGVFYQAVSTGRSNSAEE